MSDKKLKTGILGLNEFGREILDIADRTGLYQIVAVGGGDPEMSKGIAAKFQCRPTKITASWSSKTTWKP